MTYVDERNEERFKRWVLDAFDLSQLVGRYPDLWQPIIDEAQKDWALYCIYAEGAEGDEPNAKVVINVDGDFRQMRVWLPPSGKYPAEADVRRAVLQDYRESGDEVQPLEFEIVEWFWL